MARIYLFDNNAMAIMVSTNVHICIQAKGRHTYMYICTYVLCYTCSIYVIHIRMYVCYYES